VNPRHVIIILLLGLCGTAGAATQTLHAAPSPGPVASAPAPAKVAKPVSRKLDRTGRAQTGKASYYARSLAGRRMADGTRMNPDDDNAASKTLPLGTVARVTNLETGRVALVTIQDRGPYVPGRILDVSPGTARQLGIDRHDGVAKVEVAPIVVPQADGTLKPGEGHQGARPGMP
jgi:rare lipoprotein A